MRRALLTSSVTLLAAATMVTGTATAAGKAKNKVDTVQVHKADQTAKNGAVTSNTAQGNGALVEQNAKKNVAIIGQRNLSQKLQIGDDTASAAPTRRTYAGVDQRADGDNDAYVTQKNWTQDHAAGMPDQGRSRPEPGRRGRGGRRRRREPARPQRRGRGAGQRPPRRSSAAADGRAGPEGRAERAFRAAQPAGQAGVSAASGGSPTVSSIRGPPAAEERGGGLPMRRPWITAAIARGGRRRRSAAAPPSPPRRMSPTGTRPLARPRRIAWGSPAPPR